VRLRYLSFRRLVTWPGLLAGVRGRRISLPTDKGSANRQQIRHDLRGAGSRSPDGRLAPTDPGAPPIYYDPTTERIFDVTSGYYQDQQSSIAAIANAHFTMLHHAAMAGRSSLLAAVIRHTRSRAVSFSVIIGPDWHAPTQVTRSSPPDQEKTSANSSLAQSDDADRSLSAVDRSSLRHPPSSLSTSSAFRKKSDQSCRKDHRIPEFSGVISSTLPSSTPAEVVHGQSHHSAPSTPGRAGSPPLTNRPYGHHNPYPSAATITVSSRA
jgi:hypothetical protein